MSRTWYTSDTHYGHKNIIRFCGRPYATIAEHDRDLIRRHNAVVKPGDTLFHFGDLALGNIELTLPMTSELNGNRFLIPGNHDRMFSGSRSEEYRATFTKAYEAAGWTILPETIRTNIGGHPVIFSHFPPVGDSHGEDRWTEQRPANDGTTVIHGHVHEAWAERDQHFNVGVDVRGFAPVAEDTIKRWLDKLFEDQLTGRAPRTGIV